MGVMEARAIETVFRALEGAEVRYVVVGGLAVLAHGYLRATNDIDLVVDLAPENAARAVEALAGLGFRPLAPVAMLEFADSDRRREWIEEKEARVFGLFSDDHPSVRVDLFLEEPFDLEEILERARREEVAAGVEVPFLGLEDLIRMKLSAGRPRDLDDVEKLRLLREEGQEEGG